MQVRILPRGLGKNKMMTDIKYALSFIFGMVYLWSIYIMFCVPLNEGEATFTLIIAGFIFFFGGMFIITRVAIFFADNWKKP